MKGIKFEGMNRMMERPDSMTEEDCYALPVYVDQENTIMYSKWEMTDEEFEDFKKHRTIWLGVHSAAHPPVTLIVRESIFVQDTLFKPETGEHSITCRIWQKGAKLTECDCGNKK